MTWDNSPWAIEGGQTSADVGRLVARIATNGTFGVLEPDHLRVRAKDVPGGEVLVGPGAVTAPVNALGKMFQSYVGANPSDDPVTIPATGSAGGRSDLIVARVENPIDGEPWNPPADPLTGQYIFSRRYPGVDPGTEHVAQVDPSASAITLARIDIPANTGAITDAMITDLRKTTAPPLPEAATFSDTQVFSSTVNTLPPPPTGSGYRETSWVNWPTAAFWNIPVPGWATSVQLYYSLNPGLGANTWGELRFSFNGRLTVPTSFDVNFPKVSESGSLSPFTNGGGMRAQYVVGGTLSIPASERGTTVPVRIQGRTFDDATYSARGGSSVGRGTIGYLAVTFKQGPASS